MRNNTIDSYKKTKVIREILDGKMNVYALASKNNIDIATITEWRKETIRQ